MRVRNTSPIVTTRGIHQSPRTDDQYFKSALFLNTLRSVVDDDAKWWAIVRGVYDTFKYRNIMTEDMVQYFNQKTHRNLTASRRASSTAARGARAPAGRKSRFPFRASENFFC